MSKFLPEDSIVRLRRDDRVKFKGIYYKVTRTLNIQWRQIPLYCEQDDDFKKSKKS